MPRFKRKLLSHIPKTKTMRIGGFICVILVVSWFIIRPILTFISQNKVSPGVVRSLVFNAPPPLKSTNGRTNILLLGMPGGAHDGYDLTDSIQLISLDLEKKDVAIVTVPRDLWLPSLKKRINASYHEGEAKRPGGGVIVAKAAIEEVLGADVHYIVTINFSGFKRLVDLVGGVDIEIRQSFDDNLYPIEGRENDLCGGDPKFSCRYESLHFEKGQEHMDGERALKYVRSRLAIGEEGTDFARGRRQQQVILVVKQKVQNNSFWQSTDNLKQLLAIFDYSVKTDINWPEKILLFKYARNLNDDAIRRIAINSGDEVKKEAGFLVSPPPYQYGGAWVLVPRTGNFDEIQSFVACHLESSQCTQKP